MHGEGTQIEFNFPDTTTLLAPATLAWIAGLLIGSLLLMLLIKRLWALIPAFKETEQSNENYARKSAQTAIGYLRYRQTATVFLYSLLLLSLSFIAMNIVGEHLSSPKTLIVSASPGLPAASALLCAPSFALCLTSFIVLIMALPFGKSLIGTGILTMVWLFTSSITLFISSTVCYLNHPQLGITLLAAAATCAILGIWIRKYRHLGGKTTLERAKEIEEQAHLEQAKTEAARASAEGKYFTRYRPTYSSAGRLPVVGQALESKAIRALGLTPFAHIVNWDKDGITAELWDETEIVFRWEELTKLVFGDIAKNTDGAIITSQSGEDIGIPSEGDGYQDLQSALIAHIWAPKSNPN
jgi:hypothetical protein